MIIPVFTAANRKSRKSIPVFTAANRKSRKTIPVFTVATSKSAFVQAKSSRARRPCC